MRSIGRRTVAVIDEEYRLTEDRRAGRSSPPPGDRPSSPTRAGPSTSTGAVPSTTAGAGPSSSLGVPPSSSATPLSPVFCSHHPLESIDDYTIVMDDVDTTQTMLSTPSVPTTSAASPAEEDLPAPPPLRHFTRRRTRARLDPSLHPPAHSQLPHDPLPHTQPMPPQTQPQVHEGRRNPPRNRRAPTCGTE